LVGHHHYTLNRDVCQLIVFKAHIPSTKQSAIRWNV
jgi:hypothetical protein